MKQPKTTKQTTQKTPNNKTTTKVETKTNNDITKKKISKKSILIIVAVAIVILCGGFMALDFFHHKIIISWKDFNTSEQVDINGDGKLETVKVNATETNVHASMIQISAGDATKSVEYASYFIRLGEAIQWGLEDMNGDGIKEILVVHMDMDISPSLREIDIYKYENGSLEKKLTIVDGTTMVLNKFTKTLSSTYKIPENYVEPFFNTIEYRVDF